MVLTKILPSKAALILEGERKNLIISDLHLGFESSLSSNKIFLGKNTATQEIISDILEMIDTVKPDSLILLGDIKSSIKSISKNEWEDVPLFFNSIKEKIDVVLVPGNHDANITKLLPQEIELVSSIGLVIENTLLTHGHRLPSEHYSHVEKIIMGHVHPVFLQEGSVINGQRIWITIKTEKQYIFPSSTGELEITIVPSFNKYFYATHKKQYRKSISPIIQKISNFSSAKILTLDGTIIGNESIINQVL